LPGSANRNNRTLGGHKTIFNQKDLIVLTVGGVTFAVIWVALEFLFSSDPSPIVGIVGGIGVGLAWFIGMLIFRRINQESGPSEN
jgi:hypothetical protein